MDAGSTFGNVMAEVMWRRYIAAIDVARALGVSPRLVERWVRGEVLPRTEDVETLCGLLGGDDAQRLLQAAQACRSGLPDALRQAEPYALSGSEHALLLGLPAQFREAFASALERPPEGTLEAEG